MTSAVPPTDADVYSVPYSAERNNRSATLSTGLGMASAVLATVLALVLSGVAWWVAVQDRAGAGEVVIAVAVSALMAATVWFAFRPARAGARKRHYLGTARDAMQISPDGVGFPDLERGGWIVVPWSAINGAKVMTWRTVQFLHLELSPDLHATQAGAQGLDDRAVLRDLLRPAMGLIGPRFALGSLQRTPEEIDSALRQFSGGRIFLT